MRYCKKCNKRHRLYSRAWINCFGIAAQDCNLYHEDAVARSYCSYRGSRQRFKTFVDEYMDYYGIGLTVIGPEGLL